MTPSDLTKLQKATALAAMGQSHPRLVLWAAQEGRSEDLVFHLGECGSEALKAVADTEKNHAPIHGAASGGHLQCIRILWEAGGM